MITTRSSFRSTLSIAASLVALCASLFGAASDAGAAQFSVPLLDSPVTVSAGSSIPLPFDVGVAFEEITSARLVFTGNLLFGDGSFEAYVDSSSPLTYVSYSGSWPASIDQNFRTFSPTIEPDFSAMLDGVHTIDFGASAYACICLPGFPPPPPPPVFEITSATLVVEGTALAAVPALGPVGLCALCATLTGTARRRLAAW